MSELQKLEVLLARAEGENLSFRMRMLEVIHLIHIQKADELTGILTRRLQELVNLQAICEAELTALKREIVLKRTFKE